MLIGYARTSTSNQKYSLEDQIEKLTSKGCEKIFSEEISSVSSLNDGLTDLTIDADLVKSAGKKTQLKIVSKDQHAKKI